MIHASTRTRSASARATPPLFLPERLPDDERRNSREPQVEEKGPHVPKHVRGDDQPVEQIRPDKAPADDNPADQPLIAYLVGRQRPAPRLRLLLLLLGRGLFLPLLSLFGRRLGRALFARAGGVILGDRLVD